MTATGRGIRRADAFVNLKKKDFKPAVLETYKRRFRHAVASYLAYLNDPGAWKPRTGPATAATATLTAPSPGRPSASR
jgi:hypothetical protein